MERACGLWPQLEAASRHTVVRDGRRILEFSVTQVRAARKLRAVLGAVVAFDIASVASVMKKSDPESHCKLHKADGRQKEVRGQKSSGI